MFTFKFDRKNFSATTIQAALDLYGHAMLDRAARLGPDGEALDAPKIRDEATGDIYGLARNGRVLTVRNPSLPEYGVGRPEGLAPNWAKIGRERAGK